MASRAQAPERGGAVGDEDARLDRAGDRPAAAAALHAAGEAVGVGVLLRPRRPRRGGTSCVGTW